MEGLGLGLVCAKIAAQTWACTCACVCACVFLPILRLDEDVITILRLPWDEADAGGLVEALQSSDDDITLFLSYRPVWNMELCVKLHDDKES